VIGAALGWDSASWADSARVAASLGLFAGAAANHENLMLDGSVRADLFDLPAPRHRGLRGWRAVRSPGGLPVLLAGWIDDRESLAADLGLAADSPPERLYGAAYEQWGDRADSRIHGTYASLICLPDGRVRMARSPIGGLPLFYAATRDAAVICSIPRPIVAAGWPQRLREAALVRAVTNRIDDSDELSLYDGIRRVPDGAIAYLARDGVAIDRWHDICALPEVRFASDDDYVEAANDLLARATRNALGPARKPAIALSGGLDSGIACDELLRQLPAGHRLPAYTFRPLSGWQGPPAPGVFYDDGPWVEAFARSRPQLDCRFTDNAGVQFDNRARDFFLASGTACSAMILAPIYHGIHEAAARDGCDWMFSAADGNLTFSQGAPWAYPEFLRTGRWRQLWQLAAQRSGDPRPVSRRIVALALMPLLPDGLADRLRGLVRRGADDGPADLLRDPALDPGGLHNATARPPRSRQEWLAYLKPWLGLGAESVHGYEQIFGIRVRDVTHYRPLMEFCFGLPTDQFVRDGTPRWLARRMARGRMPEAQRLNRLYGRQNADWYPRLTPRRADLRRGVERIAAQPELAALIDVDRALALIDDWPASPPPPGSRDEHLLRYALPSTLLMSQYVDYMTGRNAA